MQDSVWQSTGDVYHLLFIIYNMLDEFASKPQLVPAYERSALANSLMEKLRVNLTIYTGCTNKKQSPRKLLYFNNGSTDLSHPFRLCTCM